jgi:hypothetical protein
MKSEIIYGMGMMNLENEVTGSSLTGTLARMITSSYFMR